MSGNSGNPQAQPPPQADTIEKKSQCYNQINHDGVNLERASLRVESMQTYAIVSSIILGSSIGILSLNDDLKLDENDGASMTDLVAQYLFLGLQAIALVASSYTTVIFTLMALYYSTALGLGGDECYQRFDSETGNFRMRAFQAFVVAIVSLMLCFLPISFLFVGGTKGIIMTSALAFLIAVSFYDFKCVIDTAGRTIFSPLFQPNSKIHERASRRRLSGSHSSTFSEEYKAPVHDSSEKILPRLTEIRRKMGERRSTTSHASRSDSSSKVDLLKDAETVV